MINMSTSDEFLSCEESDYDREIIEPDLQSLYADIFSEQIKRLKSSDLARMNLDIIATKDIVLLWNHVILFRPEPANELIEQYLSILHRRIKSVMLDDRSIEQMHQFIISAVICDNRFSTDDKSLLITRWIGLANPSQEIVNSLANELYKSTTIHNISVFCYLVPIAAFVGAIYVYYRY